MAALYSVQFVMPYFALGGLLMNGDYQVAGPHLHVSTDLCNNAQFNIKFSSSHLETESNAACSRKTYLQ